jgi:pyruvate,water dikinase
MSDLRSFSEIKHSDVELVGGKGLSLGLMAVAGLPVPPGFCITSIAYRKAENQRIDDSLAEALLHAYRSLGGGCVAVRSSATAEDGVETSFAGQQETILGVEGDEALRASIERCWRSLHTERAIAYRQKQGVDETSLAMAVVVQRLVHAEVAGVLFTRDPLDPSGERMRIEASWGLGEAVVSGRVTPDQFQVSRHNGEVRDRQLGRKQISISARGEEAVSIERQNQFCLLDHQLADLAALARKVEEFYGDARDVEWAYAEGQFWLLQARPITTVSAAEREQVRREQIARLREIAAPGGTVWSRYNLIEVLPEPMPMTWSIVQNLLSGGGGSGMMYRDLGFSPDPALASTTVYDLIGGRPYCNLSREPHMQAKKPVFGYPYGQYKQNPYLALDPKPDTSRMLGGFWKWLRLPGIYWNLIRSATKIQSQSKTFAENFRTKIIPNFVSAASKAAGDDLSKLDAPALLTRLDFWIKRTLIDFARDSLKPTLFAQFSMQVLEVQLKKPLGEERTRAALADLSSGAHPDPESDLPVAIQELGAGKLSRTEFLARFGHRGSQEMELAQPRWSEDPSALDRWKTTASATPKKEESTPAQRWEKWSTEAKLNRFVAASISSHVDRLQTYLGLRETAKHHLMRGYALIRQTLLELDRRFKLNGGIFYLERAELNDLIQGKELTALIAQRKKRRSIALGLEIPPVLFSDDLDAIGRPIPPPEGATQLRGVPLSAGVVEGPALVLSEPVAATDVEPGYILVCPSTDPAWVPLFIPAKGLVMESGGALSHGAIVAREFGLPAVAGLPAIHHQLKTGQRIRVDGASGTVTLL